MMVKKYQGAWQSIIEIYVFFMIDWLIDECNILN